MKKNTSGIICKIRDIRDALAASPNPLLRNYVNSNGQLFAMLDSFIVSADIPPAEGGLPEIIRCLKADESHGVIILALLQEKLRLCLKYLLDSHDEALDNKLLGLIQENVDHSIKII